MSRENGGFSIKRKFFISMARFLTNYKRYKQKM